MPEGALESNTLNCIDIHIRHFERDLGRQLSLLEIDQVKLQEYVNSVFLTVADIEELLAHASGKQKVARFNGAPTAD